MEQAFQDLLWMSKRLAGIIELKDEIENYSVLKRQISDMTEQSEHLKTEILDLESTKVQVKSDIDIVLDNARKQEEDAIKEAKDIISKAKKQAEGIISKANTTAGEKIAEAVKKVNNIEEQEAFAQSRYSNLISSLSTAEKKLNSIKTELESLKSKF